MTHTREKSYARRTEYKGKLTLQCMGNIPFYTPYVTILKENRVGAWPSHMLSHLTFQDRLGGRMELQAGQPHLHPWEISSPLKYRLISGSFLGTSHTFMVQQFPTP